MFNFNDNFDSGIFNSGWLVNFGNKSPGTYSASIANGKAKLTQISEWSGSYMSLNIGTIDKIVSSAVIKFKMLVTDKYVGSASVRPYMAFIPSNNVREQSYYFDSYSPGIFFNLASSTNMLIGNYSYGASAGGTRPAYISYGNLTDVNYATIENEFKIDIKDSIIKLYINNQLKQTININETILAYFKNDVYFEFYVGGYHSGQDMLIDDFSITVGDAKYIMESDNKFYKIDDSNMLVTIADSLDNVDLDLHNFKNLNNIPVVIDLLGDTFKIYNKK